MPFLKDASMLLLVSASQSCSAPMSRARSMQWKRSIRSRAVASAGTHISIAATVTASAFGNCPRCAVAMRANVGATTTPGYSLLGLRVHRT